MELHIGLILYAIAFTVVLLAIIAIEAKEKNGKIIWYSLLTVIILLVLGIIRFLIYRRKKANTGENNSGKDSTEKVEETSRS